MAGAVDILGATIPNVLEIASAQSRAGMLGIAEIEADPRDGVRTDLAVSRYLTKLSVFPREPETDASRLPAIFQNPSTLSAAFGHALREAHFNLDLEEIAADLGNITEVEDYLVRWNSFMNAFLERAFVVRALLESARHAGNTEFDRAATGEIRKMEKMIDWAHGAYRRYTQEPLRHSWPFDFVGIQLDRINQPMNMVAYYPKLLNIREGEQLNMWRAKAISELSRLTDPLSYMRGMETNETYATSLRIDLPKEAIDLFVAHPDGDRVDLAAVKENARAFSYLRNALSDIVLEAGRNPNRETHISIKYSQRLGAFLIRDMKPLVSGALYPFATEPPRSRLYSLVDRMGPGAQLRMKGALENLTVTTLVIQLADTLVPDRKITFSKAAEMRVAIQMDPDTDDIVQVDSSAEDSGVNPMASIFGNPSEAIQDEESFAGVMESTSVPNDTNPVESIFGEINAEVSGLAAPSMGPGRVAQISAGIAAGTIPIALVK